MLIQADAMNLPYPDKFFHACVTSPPYWGLRRYQGNQGEEPRGLEATPERHIERMVEVFREVRRVLRDDGVCWLNYGDCFAGSGGENANTGLGSGDRSGLYRNNPRKTKIAQGSLMLMPHRLAIALQADGWIVRNDLVWFKRNPMPESVAGWRWETKNCDCVTYHRPLAEGVLNASRTSASVGSNPAQIIQDCPKCHGTGKVGDPVLRKSSWRHTRAHEYVFMLVKKPKYYCNQEAVRENADVVGVRKGTIALGASKGGTDGGERKDRETFTEDKVYSGRNPRSVLDVPTAPYKGAHYAAFPPKLIAPLIRASVPRRCCPECGMAWAPVVNKDIQYTRNSKDGAAANYREHSAIQGGETRLHLRPVVSTTVTDYRPTCECGVTEHEPGIVLDIFGGSGTTGMVANQLMRRWVVMDISRPYLDEQAKIRTGTGVPSGALEGLPMFGCEDD